MGHHVLPNVDATAIPTTTQNTQPSPRITAMAAEMDDALREVGHSSLQPSTPQSNNLPAPQSIPLVLDRQDRRRRIPPSKHECNTPIHRRIDRDGLGANLYLSPPIHILLTRNSLSSEMLINRSKCSHGPRILLPPCRQNNCHDG